MKKLFLILACAAVAAGCVKEPVVDQAKLQAEKERQRQEELIELAQLSAGFEGPEVKQSTITPLSPVTRSEVTLHDKDGKLLVYTESSRDVEKFAVNHELNFYSGADNTQIWPGNLLQGKYISRGEIAPIDLREFRQPVAVGLNLINGSDGLFYKSGVAPTATDVNAAINEIIGSQLDNGGEFYANLDFKFHEVQSFDEVMSIVDVVDEKTKEYFRNYNWKAADKVFYLGKLRQIYYTIGLDSQASLLEVFNDRLTAADLAPYVGPGNPLAYISEVSYGRVMYILYELDRIDRQVSESLLGGLENAQNNESSTFTAFEQKTFDGAKVSVVQYGGDPQAGLETVFGNLEDFKKYLRDGVKVGHGNIGAPIYYKVNLLPVGLADHDNLSLYNYAEHSYEYKDRAYSPADANNNVTFCFTDLIGYKATPLSNKHRTNSFKLTVSDILVTVTDDDGKNRIYSYAPSSAFKTGIELKSGDRKDGLIPTYSGFKLDQLGFNTRHTIKINFTFKGSSKTQHKLLIGTWAKEQNATKSYPCEVVYHYNADMRRWEVKSYSVLAGKLYNDHIEVNESLNRAKMHAALWFEFLSDGQNALK